MNEQVFLNGAPVTGLAATGDNTGLEALFYVSPILGFVGGAVGGYYLSGTVSNTRRAAAIGSAAGGAAGAVVLTNLIRAIAR